MIKAFPLLYCHCRVASFVVPDMIYLKKKKKREIIKPDLALSCLKWPWELNGMRLDKLVMLSAGEKWRSDECK